jgi:hypothetical protein
VTSFSNIALPPDLDDILDIDASMEGKSSTIDSCLQGMNEEEQCIEEQWQMKQKEQTAVITDTNGTGGIDGAAATDKAAKSTDAADGANEGVGSST